MKIDVTAGMTGINFSPQSTEAEVIQNVRCILATRKGSVPFDRAFGVSWDMLDRPLPVAKAMMIAAVVEAIQEYEPRAEVRGVKFNADGDAAMEGILNPVVTIEINEGKSTSSLHGRRYVSTAASAPKAETNAETEAVTTSDVSIITQKAEQAIAAAKAATAALANLEPRLHEIEASDYSAIYDQG
ncbi:MAG: GPW/gp25 family protein [Desulfovibrionaceae bacterium]|nr:GPW/gp25 family protein [Desulfovibrionaceae bacterium]